MIDREKADYVLARRDVTTRLARKQALELGAPHVIVFVRPLIGMQRAADGSTRKLFVGDTLTGSSSGYESDFIDDKSSHHKNNSNNSNKNQYSSGATATAPNPNVDRVLAFAAQTVFAAHPTGRPDPRWVEAPAPTPQVRRISPVFTRKIDYMTYIGVLVNIPVCFTYIYMSTLYFLF